MENKMTTTPSRMDVVTFQHCAFKWLPVPGHTLIVVLQQQLVLACCSTALVGVPLLTLLQLHSCAARNSACLVFPRNGKFEPRLLPNHLCLYNRGGRERGGGVCSSSSSVSRRVLLSVNPPALCWCVCVGFSKTHCWALFIGRTWTSTSEVCVSVSKTSSWNIY